MTTTSQTIMRLRCDLWNILGHDKDLGKALGRYGMVKFNEVVDGIIAPHIEAAEARAHEAGAKAMQEVLDALSKAGPIHAGPVGGDLGRKYPDARQCVVEFAPGQGGGAYDLHSALVSLRAALDPAQIAGGQP